jgi:hypothetical protein
MDLLGQPTYLTRKLKGDHSMSEKQVSAKVCSVVRPASPVRMAKPALVEPKFPVVFQPPAAAYLTRRHHNRHEGRTHAVICWGAIPRLNALCDERPLVKRLKGMSWEPVAHYTSNECKCGIA